MAPTTNAVLPWLRLVRAGTLFSPGCDVLAGHCITSAALLSIPTLASAEPTTVARAMGASVAVYAAGMVCNDIADRREDAIQRPERPLPRGQISLLAAAVLGAGLLMLALALSPVPSHHALLAGLALAYDFALKRVRLLAAMTMAILRGLNLLTAGLIAFPHAQRSLWSGLQEVATSAPTLLVAASCYATYIGFVTILGILEDSAAPRRSHVLLVQSIPPIAAMVGIATVAGGIGMATLVALVPLGLFFRRMARIQSWDQRTIRGSMMYLLLGTMLYTALLALAAGALAPALGIAACIVPARMIARRISLT
jgi:4-hydroxybenzoate polyprenyltransferase